MSDFKAKMHQIRFRLGLCPRPRWGAYSAPPDPLAGFKGPTSKGRGGRGVVGKGKEGEEWEGGSSASIRSPLLSLADLRPCLLLLLS